MGKIISFIGCKGGSGVTTLIAALGGELSDNGKSVCLLDACVGLRGMDMILGTQDQVVFDFYDLCEDICSMEQALISIKPSLYMIAAPQMDVSEELTDKKLGHLLNRLQKRFDYVLIDCPPVSSALCAQLAAQCDECVVISVPGALASRNLERVCSMIRETRDQPILHIANFISSVDEKADAIKATADYLDICLIGILPMQEAIFMKTPGYEAWPNKLKAAVRDCAKRLNGEQIPWNTHHSWRLPWHS